MAVGSTRTRPDLALGSIEDGLAYVGRLAGRKLLVTGNHDRCWDSRGSRAAGG